ncbi:DUF1493 family protein [Brevundimonas lenta]|uniref:DUF1493 family protein n=1 Tax=Brevundimonas lenta TaxID=424796 RepID=A0A7W6JCM8_9CAUL|nr:DUF1493 family protein [Brevundimonas lenta]MBB4081706.1 hypothetical protein [Brevundimonas lenta]
MSAMRDAVLAFVEDFRGATPPLADDVDLFDVLGITGDDASEFMDAFVDRFGVDAANYLWYFHHEEEGQNFGGVFFKPPNQRVTRIPVTLAMLTEAARTRWWPVDYPEHTLPRARWDIRINLAFFALSIGALLAWAGWRFFN